MCVCVCGVGVNYFKCSRGCGFYYLRLDIKLCVYASTLLLEVMREEERGILNTNISFNNSRTDGAVG